MKRLISFALCLIVVGTIFTSACAINPAEIWISSSEFAPKYPYGESEYNTYYDLLGSVFNEASPWSTVRQNLDVLKFYEIGVNHIEKNPGVYRSAFTFLHNSNISIAVDVGGFKPGTYETGVAAATYEIQQIFKKIIEQGGDLKYILLDNYFNRMLNQDDRWKYTEMEAISELIRYIKTIKASLPDVKIGLIECVWNNDFTAPDGTVYPGINPATKRYQSPALFDRLFYWMEPYGVTIDLFQIECAYTQAELREYGWIRNKSVEDYFRSK